MTSPQAKSGSIAQKQSENLYGPGAGILLEINGKRALPLQVRRDGSCISIDFPEGITAVATVDAMDIDTALWKWRLENHGTQVSGLITRFLILRLELACDGSASPALHGSKGGLDESSFPPEAWRQWTKVLPTEGLSWLACEGGSKAGRSSNDQCPFFVIDEARPSMSAWMLRLGWSGDWNFKFFRHRETAYFELGMTNLETTLLPGESILQPELLIGRTAGQQKAAAQRQLAGIVRSRLQPMLAGQPVAPFTFWDHYFGDRGRMTEESFLQNISLAAEIGLDYVILDGGWTGGGLDGEFHSLLPHIGSWRPDPERFPNGFGPIAARVAEKGRKLGLWFDIEQAHTESESFRLHPELFHAAPLSPYGVCRLLRLDSDAGLEWAFETIATNVRLSHARWLRMDFNADPQTIWAGADFPQRRGITECRYVENLWKLMERLLAEFPDVMLENCSSGGRRIDLGTVRRTHCDWISDHTQSEAIIRYHLHGAGRWLPAARLNTTMAHTYLEPNRQVDWRAPLPASAYLSHFGGNFGLSDYPATYGYRGMAELAKYVALYREVAPCFADTFIRLGHQADLYEGSAGFAGHCKKSGMTVAILFGNTSAPCPASGVEEIDCLMQSRPFIDDAGDGQFTPVRMWQSVQG